MQHFGYDACNSLTQHHKGECNARFVSEGARAELASLETTGQRCQYGFDGIYRSDHFLDGKEGATPVPRGLHQPGLGGRQRERIELGTSSLLSRCIHS